MQYSVTSQEANQNRTGVFAWIFRAFVLYFVLVFGGGTLIKTGHPVAAEAGRLMQVVTLVDPTIRWADAHGYHGVARGLRAVADGISMRGRGSA